MSGIYIEGYQIVTSGGTGGTGGVSASGHLLLVYVDDAGKEYVIRGGNNSGTLSLEIDMLLDISSDAYEEGATPESRGRREIDLGGRAPADVWNVLKQHAENIDAQRFQYDPIGTDGESRNSNGVVANLLSVVGIDVNLNLPDPDGVMLVQFHGVSVPFDFSYSIIGTDGADYIVGHALNQVVNGAGGNDVLFGGAGNDLLDGGDGNDILDGGADDDVVRGGEGTDVIFASLGSDAVYGGSGHDSLDFRNIASGVTIYSGFAFFNGGFTTFSEIEEVHGSLFDDEIHLDASPIERIDGRDGDDRIYVTSDNLPFVEGGAGYDTLCISGSPITLLTNLGKISGVEVIVNTSQNDVMVAMPGMTYISGGGSDRYVMTSGASIYGASILDYSQSGAVVIDMSTLGDSHGNSFWNYGGRIQSIIGSSGNDELSLDLSGNDPAFVDAGAGTDTLAISSAYGGAYSFNMGTGVFTEQYGSATSVYAGFEEFDARNSPASFNVVGTEGSDVIHTGSSASVVRGGGGADFIFGHSDTRLSYDGLDGGDGDDVIVGYGRDNLFGGAGNDVITELGPYGVQISDGPGQDLIQGGSGDDVISADGSGGDFFAGGAGTDMVLYPFQTSGSSVGHLISIERGGAGWEVAYEIGGEQRVDQLAADIELIMFSNGNDGFGGWPLSGDFSWHM